MKISVFVNALPKWCYPMKGFINSQTCYKIKMIKKSDYSDIIYPGSYVAGLI